MTRTDAQKSLCILFIGCFLQIDPGCTHYQPPNVTQPTTLQNTARVIPPRLGQSPSSLATNQIYVCFVLPRESSIEWELMQNQHIVSYQIDESPPVVFANEPGFEHMLDKQVSHTLKLLRKDGRTFASTELFPTADLFGVRIDVYQPGTSDQLTFSSAPIARERSCPFSAEARALGQEGYMEPQ